jgi:hypothetical protein
MRKGEFRHINSCAQAQAPLFLPNDANSLPRKSEPPSRRSQPATTPFPQLCVIEGTLNQGQIRISFNGFLAPARCGSRPRPRARNPEPGAALPNMEPSRAVVRWVVVAVFLASVIGNALRSCETVPIDTAP